MATSLSEDLQSASSKGQPAILLIKSTRGESALYDRRQQDRTQC